MKKSKTKLIIGAIILLVVIVLGLFIYFNWGKISGFAISISTSSAQSNTCYNNCINKLCSTSKTPNICKLKNSEGCKSQCTSEISSSNSISSSNTAVNDQTTQTKTNTETTTSSISTNPATTPNVLNLNIEQQNGNYVKINGYASGNPDYLLWQWGDTSKGERSFFSNEHTYSQAGNYNLKVMAYKNGIKIAENNLAIVVGNNASFSIDNFRVVTSKIKVYDEKNLPLQNINVIAIHEKYRYVFPFNQDGAPVTGVTNNNGEYNLKTIKGSYSLFVWGTQNSKSYFASLQNVYLNGNDVSIKINTKNKYSFPSNVAGNFNLRAYSEKYGQEFRPFVDMNLGSFSQQGISIFSNGNFNGIKFLIDGGEQNLNKNYIVSFSPMQSVISFSNLKHLTIKTTNNDSSISESIAYQTILPDGYDMPSISVNNHIQNMYTNLDKLKVFYRITKGSTTLTIIRNGTDVIDTNLFNNKTINYGTSFRYVFHAVNETNINNDKIDNRTSIFNIVYDQYGNFVSGTNLNGPEMIVKIYDLRNNLVDSYTLQQFWTTWYTNPPGGVAYYDPNKYKIKMKIDLKDFGSKEIYLPLNDSSLFYSPTWYETDLIELKMVSMFPQENLLFNNSVMALINIGVSQFGEPPQNPCGKLQFSIHWGWDKPACRSTTNLMAGPEYTGVSLLDPMSLPVPGHELGHAFTIGFCFPRGFDCVGGNEPAGWMESIATTFSRGTIVQLYGDAGDDRGVYNGLMKKIWGYETFDQNSIDIMQSIEFIIWEEYGYDKLVTLVRDWNTTLKPKRQILANNGFTPDQSIAVLLSDITGDNLGWLFELGGAPNINESKVNEGLNLIRNQR